MLSASRSPLPVIASVPSQVLGVRGGCRGHPLSSLHDAFSHLPGCGVGQTLVLPFKATFVSAGAGSLVGNAARPCRGAGCCGAGGSVSRQEGGRRSSQMPLPVSGERQNAAVSGRTSGASARERRDPPEGSPASRGRLGRGPGSAGQRPWDPGRYLASPRLSFLLREAG